MKNKTISLFSVFFIGCIVLFFLFRPSGREELREEAVSQNPESNFALGVEYFYGTETRKANPELARHVGSAKPPTRFQKRCTTTATVWNMVSA